LPTQREEMLRLFNLLGPDRDAVCEGYVRSEREGRVGRKSMAQDPLFYARGLWADGVAKGWLPISPTPRTVRPRGRPKTRDTRIPAAPLVEAMPDLHARLLEFGRLWAADPARPSPAPEMLAAWDGVLDRWIASDLPLILRIQKRIGETARSRDGRTVIFADNMPANWALASALEGEVPNIDSWTAETLANNVPLSMVSRSAVKVDLNQLGWKVCHIDGVSDRRRGAVEDYAAAELGVRMRRFLSPRNMFVIPKVWSGAGELPEVIEAVRMHEARGLAAP
jgi:hypothetical protein